MKRKISSFWKLKWSIIATGMGLLGLGLLVLIGWHSELTSLIQVHPSFVPMQYNTALCFVLIGVSILFLFVKKKKVGLVFAIMVGVIALSTLLEYLLQVNFGIDEVFMNHYVTVETSHPGRMAPNTALCFLLTSSSLIIGTKKSKKLQIRGVIGSLIFGLGLVAIVGYMVGQSSIYGWGRFTQMAVHTAFGFLLAGISVTAISWNGIRLNKETQKSKYKPWVIGYTSSIAFTLFLVDINVPAGYSAGVPFIVLVLGCWFYGTKKETIYLAIVSTVLIIMGYILSPPGINNWIVILNRIFAIMAVWVVAYLVLMVGAKEAKLNKNLELTKKQNDRLLNFAHIVSHNLRSHTGNLEMMLNFMKSEGNDAEKSKELLSHIFSISDALSSTVSHLTEVVQIQTDTGIKKEELNLRDFMDRGLASLSSDLMLHNVLIVNNINSSYLVNFNPSYLDSIILNLLSNAIRYRSPDRRLKLVLSSELEAGFVSFSVKDNGLGIDLNRHGGKLFGLNKTFHKHPDSRGVGLFITKNQIEVMNGKIEVESKQLIGSTFKVFVANED